jgi:hypothetical protein
VGNHDVAAAPMNLDEADSCQGTQEAGTANLGQPTHAALDPMRNVWKLARGFGMGRLSFFNPSR